LFVSAARSKLVRLNALLSYESISSSFPCDPVRPELLSVAPLTTLRRASILSIRIESISGCMQSDHTKKKPALLALAPNCGIAILGTALFGASVFKEGDFGSSLEGALFMIASAGTGWAFLIAASALLPAPIRAEYLAHLGATMTVGVAALGPGILLAVLLPPPTALPLLLLSVAPSFAVMAVMQRARVARMGLSPSWWIAWIVALVLGAACWSAWWTTHTIA
jgi:hypothetical protein